RSHVDAEIVSPNSIRLDTENVLSVELRPDGEWIDRNEVLKVIWNGDAIETRLDVDGRAVLNAPGYSPGSLVKKPSLAGPAGDLWETPFAIILGTQGDIEWTEAWKEYAEKLRSDWKKWQNQPPRFFVDTELSEADSGKYSLILVGGPDENVVAAKIAGKLPVKTDGADILIDEFAVEAPDAAYQVVYPSPFNSDRYILAIGSTSAQGIPYAHDLSFDFDYCIVDGKKSNREEGIFYEDAAVAVGFFDFNWHFSREWHRERRDR
ncbi:MAG: hypothetical protein KJ626_06445, partial [Verrucomicrobia bacterium]|nr:hypothetical protein [Verrucomicrobiota bacterium]